MSRPETIARFEVLTGWALGSALAVQSEVSVGYSRVPMQEFDDIGVVHFDAEKVVA